MNTPSIIPIERLRTLALVAGFAFPNEPEEAVTHFSDRCYVGGEEELVKFANLIALAIPSESFVSNYNTRFGLPPYVGDDPAYTGPIC